MNIKLRVFYLVVLGLMIMLSNGCKTDEPIIENTVTDIDGNVYHTVKIGTQTWMVENLKTTKYINGNGATIRNVEDAYTWNHLLADGYCNYDNKEANGLKYGRLYNWYAVTDSRQLAPKGWHVSTEEDWTTLINYLIANGYNYDKTKDDNRAAKSLAATTDWTTFIGTGAIGNDFKKNNSTGFSALPGGCRSFSYPDATFDGLNISSYWWSIVPDDIYSFPYGRSLVNNSSYVFRNTYSKQTGFYVRCVKD